MLIPQTKFLHSVTPGAAYAEIPGSADVVMMRPEGFARVVAEFCG